MELKIREATKTDAGLVNSMASIVFPATYREILSPEQLDFMMDWMYSIPNLERQIEGGHTFFLAYVGDPGDKESYIGYASVEQQGENLFHLQKIYVLPGYQGKNIGGELFDHVINHIKKIHPNPFTLELNVNRNNKAVGFYISRGMVIDRQGDFPIGNGYFMNDYIMKLEIDN